LSSGGLCSVNDLLAMRGNAERRIGRQKVSAHG
jgi:hypothetical protein